MAILKDKKVIIIGDRDGIPGPAIEECVKTAGAEVVYSSGYRFSGFCISLSRITGIYKIPHGWWSFLS